MNSEEQLISRAGTEPNRTETEGAVRGKEVASRSLPPRFSRREEYPACARE